MVLREVALTFALSFFTGVDSVFGDCSNLSQSLDTLLAEYDRNSLPADSVTVSAAINLRHATIYDGAASVRILGDLHLNWKDERLKWNSSEWGCNSSLVSAERLWLPDVVLVSVSTSEGTGDSVLRAALASNGAVAWVRRLDLTVPITMQLYSWPADQNLVTFKFASRLHSNLEIQLKLIELESAVVFESGGWELVSMRGSESKWRDSIVERDVVAWEVTLRRRAAAHALAAAAVLASSAILLLAALMQPPSSRLISASIRLPAASAVPLRVSLATAAAAGACAAAVGAALVLRVARVAAPPPALLRAMLDAARRYCRLTPPESCEGSSSAWAAAAQLLDRAVVSALLALLFVVFCFSL